MFCCAGDEDKNKFLEDASVTVVPVGKRGQGPAGTLRFGDGEERDVERHTYQFTHFFRDPDNDGWMARQAINDLFVSTSVLGRDLYWHLNTMTHHVISSAQTHPIIPEPEVTVEVLKCIKRMNDFALAVRYLESLQVKVLNQIY